MSYTDSTALIEGTIGADCHVWHYAHVRGDVGAECVLARGVYIDAGVHIGDRCKIGNYAQIFGPALIRDGVFIGPGAMLINDRDPRAVNADGSLKGVFDWTADGVIVNAGASIGAGAIILPGVVIGAGAMVGAGAVVTRDVPAGETWVGVPAAPAAIPQSFD